MTSDGPLQKADFGAIYDQPDPRAYFRTLEPFDYLIPQHGAELIARLLHARHDAPGPRSRILDVCCSYGVVVTLMKTRLDLAAVYAHYREAAEQELTTEQLVDLDRRLLQAHADPGSPTVIGLDVAPRAVEYALATGTLDAGVVENLEVDEPSAELAALMSEVDLVTTTGGVGYVTEKTFTRLLDVAPESVWVAAFCLRTYDYRPIVETLRTHGLRTERLPRTFAQRRFADPTEQECALAEVRRRGLDPRRQGDPGVLPRTVLPVPPRQRGRTTTAGTAVAGATHAPSLTPLTRRPRRKDHAPARRHPCGRRPSRAPAPLSSLTSAVPSGIIVMLAEKLKDELCTGRK